MYVIPCIYTSTPNFTLNVLIDNPIIHLILYYSLIHSFTYNYNILHIIIICIYYYNRIYDQLLIILFVERGKHENFRYYIFLCLS